MEAIDHLRQPKEEWRPGVMTQMRISELTGAKDLCVFDQWCAPGSGAPLHRHSVEEVLSVISGTAEFRFGDTTAVLNQAESVVIPAGVEHGFQNIGTNDLHMHVILAAGYFEAVQSSDGVRIVRWRTTLPG